MPSLRRSLASLPALVTFEAAARLESFTRAAAELGVTQAAVSRQIRALEEDLGSALFQRSHRRVELTRAGQRLAAAVGRGLADIADAVEDIRRAGSGQDVAIGATLAFSHFWLLPRLSDFRRRNPAVQLRLLAQDNPFHWRRDHVQIVIRYGRPPFPGDRVMASMGDSVFPVCSPDFLARHGQPASDAALFDLPLIASDWIDPTWPSWTSWAGAAGLGRIQPVPALRFTHYIDTVHAAMNGEGVAMGWGKLLSRPMAGGSLVRLGRLCVTPEEGYHLTVPEGAPPGPAAQKVIDWFAAAFAAADAEVFT